MKNSVLSDSLNVSLSTHLRNRFPKQLFCLSVFVCFHHNPRVLNPAVLWLTLPIGLITVGILHANNIRDIEHDQRAGIHTLAMLLGKKVSVFLYCTYMLLPFIWVIVTAILGIFPMWSLFVLVALKPALDNIAKAVRYPREGMAAMNGVDEKTAQLQLAFSLILTLSLVIPALV